MAKLHSIVTDDLEHDFIDGSYPVEIHHIFSGPNRRLSDEDGLVVGLNHFNHNEPPNGVHFNKNVMELLHKVGQLSYELNEVSKGLSHEEAHKKFLLRYRKNYL